MSDSSGKIGAVSEGASTMFNAAPVTLIPDHPAVPRGYTVCAYEVGAAGGEAKRYGGTPVGFGHASQAVRRAGQASQAGGSDNLTVSLTAVAWWIDRPIEECELGRERLVAVYDVTAGQWSEWQAESRDYGRGNVRAPKQRCWGAFGVRDPRSRVNSDADGAN